MTNTILNGELPKNYYSGQHYVEEKNFVPVQFDIEFYSPTEIAAVDIYHNKKKISLGQENHSLMMSFVENLQKSLLEDIFNGKRNSKKYVFGLIYSPLHKLNQEVLKQRYGTGMFLANTFSFFDIKSITLTDLTKIDIEQSGQVVSIDCPTTFLKPLYPDFGKASSEPEIFVRDYIDAWNDYFKGDCDNCVRKLITCVENSLEYYKLNKKRRLFLFLKRRRFSFVKVIKNLYKEKTIGHKTVIENILFIYQIRNKIVHDSYQVHQENGWWFCGKALETLQYYFQFLEHLDSKKNSEYIFWIYGFGNMTLEHIKGNTVEADRQRGEFYKNQSDSDIEKYSIKNDEDMNKFKFGNLIINDKEKIKMRKNKPRE